ncbi:MAG TPA: adenylate/guanylate cyclase domain-containing protein [Alphaproteobacteria bacterium]|nr:adenylate/guanylate cyclase domain-containing protein [Alphaproteobacteria bacterium]
MEARTKGRLRLWAILAGAGAGAGLVYMPFISETVTTDQALRFAAQGALIASLVFGFEIFVAQGPASEPLRRAPFAVAFFAKALITTALVVIAYWIGGLSLFPGRFAAEAPVLHLARDTGYALSMALVLQFVLMVKTIVGGRVLVNLILGRYHRPLGEERVFMFLDVIGSTALAERLGDIGAYSMISRFFFDVAQETARYGGETHEYIGDAVVVTWPLDRAIENARCVECYFAIRDRMKLKAPVYEREFGLVPMFRAGLHGGPVVAGECGDDKREIVYFGDAINTAARIQEACKAFQRSLLVSGDLLGQMNLPPIYTATSLGRVRLRGREKEVELFAVQR